MQKHKKMHFIFIILNFMALFTLTYFIYHSFIGNRGYLELTHLKKELVHKKHMLHEHTAEREYFENRVNLLYDKSINKDLLDELARNDFGLIGENEICIILDKS